VGIPVGCCVASTHSIFKNHVIDTTYEDDSEMDKIIINSTLFLSIAVAEIVFFLFADRSNVFTAVVWLRWAGLRHQLSKFETFPW